MHSACLMGTRRRAILGYMWNGKYQALVLLQVSFEIVSLVARQCSETSRSLRHVGFIFSLTQRSPGFHSLSVDGTTRCGLKDPQRHAYILDRPDRMLITCALPGSGPRNVEIAASHSRDPSDRPILCPCHPSSAYPSSPSEASTKSQKVRTAVRYQRNSDRRVSRRCLTSWGTLLLVLSCHRLCRVRLSSFSR